MTILSIRYCERSEAIQSRRVRYWIAASLTLLAMTLFFNPAFAQDETVDATYDQRLELAQKMHEFRPVSQQVESAVNQYAQTQAPDQREAFKTAMRSVLNIKALEKISVDAYADTFTLPELQAMVEYYSKPEARSASDKFDDYAGIVYPEIVRMLDRAAMRVKTGGN
ncbi:MAG: hypothetical protein ACPGRX_00775 [Bdellovibrionales bacterium]